MPRDSLSPLMVQVLLDIWAGKHDRQLKQRVGLDSWEGPLWQSSAMAAFMLTQFPLSSQAQHDASRALLCPPKFWDNPKVINAAAYALIHLEAVDILEEELDIIKTDGLSGPEADYLKLLSRRVKAKILARRQRSGR